MELSTLLLLELMAKTKASSKSDHRNKMMFCSESSHLFAGSTVYVAGTTFLKLVLITDDQVLLATLVAIFRSWNTEARTLRVWTTLPQILSMCLVLKEILRIKHLRIKTLFILINVSNSAVCLLIAAYLLYYLTKRPPCASLTISPYRTKSGWLENLLNILLISLCRSDILVFSGKP